MTPMTSFQLLCVMCQAHALKENSNPGFKAIV